MTEYEVHPFADRPPMLPPDELKALAKDIKENGQQFPITIQDGKIIDGRNRLAACKLAGVEPIIHEVKGKDVKRFVVSASNRRNMNKGQFAMLVAMAYPEPEKAGRKKNGSSSEPLEVSKSYLSSARKVLKHQPDLAESVLKGSVFLTKAVEKTDQDIEDNEDKDQKLVRLQSLSPQIAEKVSLGELDVEQGFKQYEAEEEEKRVERLGFWTVLEKMDSFSDVFTDEGKERLAGYLEQYGNSECDADIAGLSEKLIVIANYLGEKADGN